MTEFYIVRAVMRFIRNCARDFLSFIFWLAILLFLGWLAVKHLGFGIYIEQIWMWILEFVEDVKSIFSLLPKA